MPPGQTITDSISGPISGPDAKVASAALRGDEHRWFVSEVHSYEDRLTAYLRRKYPTVRDVEDVVQESYLRIWRARLRKPLASTRSFLFRVADHLAIDVLRRVNVAKTICEGDLRHLEVTDERPAANGGLSRQEKIDLLSDALAALPERCRAVMMMKKFEELPLDEIARRLGISVRTVENQINRGTKLLNRYLQERGVDGFQRDER